MILALSQIALLTFVNLASAQGPSVSCEFPGVLLTDFRQEIVLARDVNGDNLTDIVALNGGGRLLVLLNEGLGNFSQAEEYGSGSSPRDIVSADLDGNGFVDFVYPNSNGTVSVLLNDGEGRFEKFSTFPAGMLPQSISTGDFNGDKHVDLAVANRIGRDVFILVNDGSGSFSLLSETPLNSAPYSTIAGDFDGDGDIDCATANFDDSVSVLLNNGDGTKFLTTDFPVGEFPIKIETADLDSDSDLDLIVANSESSDFTVLINDGSGDYSSTTTYKLDFEIDSIEIVDVNGDSIPDVAAGNNTIAIFLNPGDGILVEQGETRTLSSDITFGHFDNDPYIDLLTNDIAVFYGDENGFRLKDIYETSNISFSSSDIALKDFDLDADPDLLVVNDENIQLFLNNGNGVFIPPITFSFFESFRFPSFNSFTSFIHCESVV